MDGSMDTEIDGSIPSSPVPIPICACLPYNDVYVQVYVDTYMYIDVVFTEVSMYNACAYVPVHICAGICSHFKYNETP